MRRTWTGTLLVALFVTAAVFAQRSASGTIPTERIFEALEIREGQTVCEMGAGDGELSIAAARLVGASGRVYTSELGDERVKTLGEKTRASNLRNISVVHGDAGRTNFPEGACDAVFMRNVYHHFAEPEKINASILASLRQGGRLAVVDFTPPGKEAGRPQDRGRDGMHGISPESLTRELKEAGFEPVSSDLGSERWFLVVAMKK
jgi:ubiquinone/menaquinone biosynthesis C-methylase UbiE